MNRDELLKKITAVDFYIIDLHLYLNTHPTDKEAISKYNAAVKESRELRETFERMYGPLSYNFISKYPWQWIDNPWPWQYKFNFDLAGDDM